jgi:hypothetical protein
MPNYVSLNPELVRLAQMRARETGAQLELELARAVAEESVLQLDPDLNFMLDSGAALSSFDVLAGAVGANDLSINDHLVDVRVLDADMNVHVDRPLVGTPYLASGSLVVQMQGNYQGAVVAYIGPGAWLSAEQSTREGRINLAVETPSTFDLAATLQDVCSRKIVHLAVPEKSLPTEQDLTTFFMNADKMIVARQKQIVSAIATNSSTRELLAQVEPQLLKRYRDARTSLSSSATWNSRVDSFAGKVAPTFPSLTMDEIKNCVRKTGEFYGGQPDAPAFRKEALSKLSREQLARKFAGVPVAKVMGVLELVFNGRSPADSVKEQMQSNKAAVDIAAVIKRGRKQMEGFVAATADEIGNAFQQMALQPSYATHSATGDTGVEAINEALQLLEAGEMAEQIRKLEQDLTAR